MATLARRASLRTRPVDPARPLLVLLASDVDQGECVPARISAHISTGMEREEEEEIHVKEAIAAQKASALGQQSNDDSHTIPTLKAEELEPTHYERLYRARPQPHPHAMRRTPTWHCLKTERAQYDADTADDKWLAERPRISARTLEHVFQQLEQESSETRVCMPSVARQRLRYLDRSTVDELYDYWLQKKEVAATTSRPPALIPRLRIENRGGDVGGEDDPYVAFRKRLPGKMQTRKDKRNDEDTYEKALKLTCDLRKTVHLFDLLRRREKTKLALVDVENDILLGRIAMVKSWGQQSTIMGLPEAINENEAVLDDVESFVRTLQEKSRHATQRFNGGAALPTRSTFLDKEIPSRTWLKKNNEAWRRMPPENYSSILGSLSHYWNVILRATTVIGETSSTRFADAGQSGAPYNTRFTFKPRPGCHYRAPAPIPSTSKQQQSGGAFDVSPVYRRICSAAMCDPSLWVFARVARASPSESPWTGLMRRRVGRGGRILHDYIPQGSSTDADWLNDRPFAKPSFDLPVDTTTASIECPWRGEWNTSEAVLSVALSHVDRSASE